MKINIDVSRTGIKQETIDKNREKVDEAMENLWDGKHEGTGWVRLPMDYDRNKLERILMLSDVIREQCTMLVVVGVGGSYLGAHAVIEAIGSYPGSPIIRFAGNTLSGTKETKLIEEMRQHEVCLLVISKSGNTMETCVSYAVLKDVMKKRYAKDDKYKERIYVITDEKEGLLREQVKKENYVSFPVRNNIGGRYSVLSVVGLLPIAVAGIDVKRLLAGAEACASSTAWDHDAIDYAVCRYELMKLGKAVEIFGYFEPQLEGFVDWTKQLFGESEGKDGKGLLPVSVEYTKDLHSFGQFIQEGSQIFFETIISVENPPFDIVIPEGAGELTGRSMNEVNQAAVKGAIDAHKSAEIPIVSIEIPELTEFYIGQLIYFFETTCALTASLMGVNPFDQPGVEKYKIATRKYLNLNR